jgi:hypothetical protein
MGTFLSFIYFALPSSLWGNWWADVIEILFFSSLIYATSLWLKKDRQKPLLLYFYGYCTLVLVSYYAQLSTMSTFLFWAAPATSMLFILMHQDILQKRVIALKKHIPAQRAEQEDWLENLFRSCLLALNKKNTTLSCVIEHTDSLHQFLTTPLLLEVPLQENLLDLLFASNAYDTNKILWISAPAHIRGINASWKMILEKEWLSTDVENLPVALQHALFFTSKTDAVGFSLDPETRTINLVIQGKLYEKISTQHALMIVKKYLRSPESRTKGAITHESCTQKTSSGQPAA